MKVATKVGVSPQDARAETEAQIRECIQEHEAELGDGSQVIVFRRPGTSVYSMTFRIQGGYLIVTGDLGEAVYQWSERLTWDFLAGLNFGYFESKCQAHRNGYNARGWDDSVAEYRLAKYLRDAFPEESPPEGRGVAGAGGFSLGFHAAGYHVVAAADGSHPAALTYLLNLGAPETVVHVLPGFEDLGKRDAAWHEEHAGTSMTAAEYFERCPGTKRKQGSDQQPGDGWISAEIDHERGSCCDHIDDPEERVEWCKSFHSTPTHRRPCLHYFLGDIYELTGEMILDALGMEMGEITSVVGGPPCQGFSKLNRNAGPHDVRNLLVFEFGRLVLELRPKSMVMENVPEMLDMLTPEGIPVVDALCRMLEDGNYGSYDALRKSLTAGMSEGVRGALRGRPKSEEEEEPSPQMGLPL